MLRRLRSHLAGNLVGYLALFLALGGTASALSSNIIGTLQIRPFAIHNSDIAAGQVNYRTLGTNSVGSRNLSLPAIKEASVDVPNNGSQATEVACDFGQKVLSVGTHWLNPDGTVYDGPDVYINYAKLLTTAGGQGGQARGANFSGTPKKLVVQALCLNR